MEVSLSRKIKKTYWWELNPWKIHLSSANGAFKWYIIWRKLCNLYKKQLHLGCYDYSILHHTVSRENIHIDRLFHYFRKSSFSSVNTSFFAFSLFFWQNLKSRSQKAMQVKYVWHLFCLATWLCTSSLCLRKSRYVDMVWSAICKIIRQIILLNIIAWSLFNTSIFLFMFACLLCNLCILLYLFTCLLSIFLLYFCFHHFVFCFQ